MEGDDDRRVQVIGGGLAGCECALQLADRGIDVTLYEQRPQGSAPAHHTDGLAELVCSNSLKSTKETTAAGQLKWELEAMGSRLLAFARQASMPAGGALAVDRERFSHLVTDAVVRHPHIRLVRQEVTEVPRGRVVVAAGPLCSQALFSSLQALLGTEALSFFDAAAPIVDADTIDRTIAFRQSRYEDGAGDYLNCPMDRDEYDAFVRELLAARRVVSRDFEQRDLFCACQPIEEVARTGHDAIRFGALKPVGLTDPRTGRRPHAAVQLRAENAQCSAYNLVGFQTNLAWPEQERVFRMIPGLEHVEFFRLGVMHRNTFVDAPRCLDATFAIPGATIRLAGQIAGTEGYVEAMASGLLAALNAYAEIVGSEPVVLPDTGSLGSLVAYATNSDTRDYQPSHVNFGMYPALDEEVRNKARRNELRIERARRDLSAYLASRPDLFPGRDA